MPSDDFDLTQRLTLVALAAFSAAWVTALGAAVGSFLNVVVYRSPRGMSLVRPKSRCPACGASIRPGDNVPVLGWLRLRGRCRDCRNPISSRYPLVEATTAALFLGLAHFELFSGGANLPGGPPRAEGLGFVLWHLRPVLIGLYVYHAVLLATLLCLALIAYDGFRPPRGLVTVAALVGLVLPVFTPARPVVAVLADRLPALSMVVRDFGMGPVVVRPAALLDGVLGLAGGLTVGAAVGLGAPGGPRRGVDRAGTLAAGGLTGLFLGWQAAVSCGLLAAGFSVLNGVTSRLCGRSLPVTALLAATVPIQIVFWRDTLMLPWWPRPNGWGPLSRVGWPEDRFAETSLAVAVVITAALAWVGGRMARADSAVPVATEQDVAEANRT
jgi:leader peptidase (prepilin peptidase)/N-methyltransferase